MYAQNQTNNKRDYDMAMGTANMQQQQHQQQQQPMYPQQGQGTPSVAGSVGPYNNETVTSDSGNMIQQLPFMQPGGQGPAAGATGQQNNGGYFFPPQQQQMPNNGPQQNNPHQQLPMNFSPQQMGMSQMPMGFDPRTMQFMPPQFFGGVVGVDGQKQLMAKTEADWALEKRRARNRVTAAESRRKSKEEIQSLREELIRLKDERQEKEDMIEYYRNRYEKYETTDQPISSVATTLVGMSAAVENVATVASDYSVPADPVVEPVVNAAPVPNDGAEVAPISNVLVQAVAETADLSKQSDVGRKGSEGGDDN